MKTLFSLLLLAFGSVMLIAQDGGDAAETAASLYNKGLEALKSKSYTEGYDLLMKAIDMADPEEDADVLKLAKANGSKAAYYAGSSDSKAGNHDAAIEKFEKGIELDPASYTNQSGIGKTLRAKGMQLDAIDAYLKAGAMATEAGKADRAASYAKTVSAIVSKLYTAKKYDDVVAGGQKFLDAGHEKETVSYYIAQALFKSGKASDAIAHAEKAVELGGDASEGKYIYTLAQILEKAGQKSAAMAKYRDVPPGKYYENAQYKASGK